MSFVLPLPGYILSILLLRIPFHHIQMIEMELLTYNSLEYQ